MDAPPVTISSSSAASGGGKHGSWYSANGRSDATPPASLACFSSILGRSMITFECVSGCQTASEASTTCRRRAGAARSAHTQPCDGPSLGVIIIISCFCVLQAHAR